MGRCLPCTSRRCTSPPPPALVSLPLEIPPRLRLARRSAMKRKDAPSSPSSYNVENLTAAFTLHATGLTVALLRTTVSPDHRGVLAVGWTGATRSGRKG